MNKTFRILELVWLFMACAAILVSAFFLMSGQTKDALYFLLFTFASGIMYAVRRKQRIRFEQHNKKNQNQNK
jgi:hypothetical protein